MLRTTLRVLALAGPSLVAACLCAGAATQAPATPPAEQIAPPEAPQDLAVLAKQLAAAHGLDPAAPEIRSFHADIKLEPQQGDRIEVNVGVDFQAPGALRCKLYEKGVRVERGRDPKLGPWAISGDQVVKLQGPEHNKEAEETIARDIRLCRQLLRFLDPGRLLGAMQDAAPVRKADLEINKRTTFVGCTVVEGTIERFPTYSDWPEGRARVTLYLHPETKCLLAVHALPLGEDGKPKELAELAVLDEYNETKGVRLPTKVNVYRLAGPGKEFLMTVWVGGIELRKEFRADHFARPK